MRIKEVVELTQATLLNEPPIASFQGLATSLKGVKRGTLFFAKDPLLIPQALAQGAYGILCEKTMDLPLEDQEVAWLQVESLEEAALRIARYLVITHALQVVMLPTIEWKIARELSDLKSTLFFEGDSTTLLERMTQLDSKPWQWIFLHQKNFERLSPTILRSSPPLQEPFELTSHTLFDSKIFYLGYHYTLPLPHLFLKPLANVINFYQSHAIHFSLANLRGIDAMRPHFLNARKKITRQGQSNQVVIAEKEIELFEKYLTYLKLHARWAKILFLIPQPFLEIFEHIEHSVTYSDTGALLDLIQNQEYHFCLILGVDSAFLEEQLQETREESSLF